MLLSELLTINHSISGQLNAAETRILAAAAKLDATIVDLKAQLANVALSAEQEQSVNDVIAAAKGIDDIVPVPPGPVPAVAVPTIIGLNLVDATAALVAAGLVVATIGDTTLVVVSQVPDATTIVDVGSTVTATF